MAPQLRLSPVATAAPVAATVALFSKVSDMKSRGEVVNGALCVGQPDFPPPPEVVKATAEAATSQQTNYTAVAGMLELRQAIVRYLLEQKKVKYEPDEILVSCGGKQAIYQVVVALCQAGDEVIVPAPYWTSYPDIVKISGATPVIMETSVEQSFAVDASQLAATITPNTRMVILCSPSNPTGCSMTMEQLEAVAEVLRRPENQHVLVLSDEIYERISFEGVRPSFAALEGMRGRTITINGFSKAFSMTGYRVGYMAAPKEITKAALGLQSQITSCAPSVSQFAALAGLNSPDALAYVDEKVKELQGKRDRGLELLLAIPGVTCPKPGGAFYLFPDVSAYFGRSTPAGEEIKSASDLSMHLLDEYKVALVPGDAFGNPRCLRLSYAATFENITDAVTKLGECLQALQSK